MKAKPIRYALVGLGHIAQFAVLPAFGECKNSELTALVSRDAKKLEVLGKKYRIPASARFTDYERCLRSGAIDAVYLAVPNELHKEYTIAAAQAGIHVLCEKPMALTSADCEEMIRVCDEHHVKLMIAYRLHFEAANLHAISLIHHKHTIGEPRIMESIHSQLTNFPNIRTEPVSRGGGPTYDLGVYDINAARYLFRDEPVSVFTRAVSSNKEAFREIEESMSVILEFPRARLASIVYSFDAADTDTYRVTGTKGSVNLEPAYTYVGGKKLRITSGSRSRQKSFRARDHFSPEIDYFARCIVDDAIPEPSGVEGLADVRIIEAIFRSAETGKRVELAPFHKRSRPGIALEIDRPATKEPEVFHAESPTRKAG